MDKIGNKIKKIRELRDYSRQYVAARLNLSLNSYGKIERNEVSVTLQRLEKIAEILGVTVIYLIAFDENMLLDKRN